MKRKVMAVAFAFAFAVAGLAVAPKPADAFWGQYPSGDNYMCTHLAGQHFCLYESSSATGDNLVANTYFQNLAGYTHIFSGHCQRASVIYLADDWNDCISSVRMWINSGQKLCLYYNAWYNSTMAYYYGPRSGTTINLTGGKNDALSSIRFVSSSSSC